MFETLEDRQVLSTFLVTGTGDAPLTAGAMFSQPVAGSADTYALPSLRAAVEAANAHTGNDTITFAKSLANQTIVLTHGKLAFTDVTGKTSVLGQNASHLTIDGNHASRVFNIGAGASVAISGLTITHGKSTSDGGGIGNYGTLVLSNTTLVKNSAASGGGISNRGTLTVVNSTLTANSATNGSGIYNYSAGKMTVTNSTLARNVSSAAGGAIANAGSAVLNNTIVAANVDASGASVADLNNLSGATLTASHSLIQRPGNATVASGVNGNITGQAPRLDKLHDNGGLTFTMALLPDSPALNAGSNALAMDGNKQPLTKDQRNALRVVDTTVDIGAWEGAVPAGIYCSGPYTHDNVNSVEPNLNTLGYVDGALVRVAWSDLEPSPGVYNWSLIDNQLARAEAQHIKVTLDVLNGFRAPSWLASQSGMQEFKYTFQGNSVQMPVPWNQTYLSYWTRLIQQLGNRYDGNPTISLVHMSNSTKNGFEMQLPDSTADIKQWKALGYTSQKDIDSWKTVLDAYRKAFPTKLLDVEVHPVLGEATVAKQTVAYGQKTIGDRFGVFAAWWSQHNTTVYPAMYDLLKQAAATSFATVQLVTNATQYPNGFGSGGIQQALDLAYSIGVRYFEVWDTDLWNSQFAGMFQNLDNQVFGSTTQTTSTALSPQIALAAVATTPTSLNDSPATNPSTADPSLLQPPTMQSPASQSPAPWKLPASAVDALWKAEMAHEEASPGTTFFADSRLPDAILPPALTGKMADWATSRWA